MMKINIANDFTDTPGTRYRSQSEYSAEEFREELLEPKFLEAKKNNEKLMIDFDGGYGYFNSFLEEAFGGLARIYGSDSVLETLEFESDEEESLIPKVKSYIINVDKHCEK